MFKNGPQNDAQISVTFSTFNSEREAQKVTFIRLPIFLLLVFVTCLYNLGLDFFTQRIGLKRFCD